MPPISFKPQEIEDDDDNDGLFEILIEVAKIAVAGAMMCNAPLLFAGSGGMLGGGTLRNANFAQQTINIGLNAKKIIT